jgi:hypothetical protein
VHAIEPWLPFLTGGAFAEIGRHALVALVSSHLIVQLIKRTVGDRDHHAVS